MSNYVVPPLTYSDNVEEQWVNDFIHVATIQALRKVPFTTEDVLDLVGWDVVKDNRRCGPIMKKLKGDGIITVMYPERYRSSKYRHGAPIRVWIGA